MKYLYALLRSCGAATLLLLAVPTVQAQVGIGTTSPKSSAALDITSATRGLLIPRVVLVGVNVGTPIALPETGLLVYNTSSALAGPGFYFNAGTGASPNWQRFVSSSASVGMEFWGITGNAGTNSINNFLGTTDAQDLVFKVDSKERFRMRPNATALLTSDFEVSGKSTLAGSVKVTGANSTTTLRDTYVGLSSDKALLTVNGDIITYAASGNGGGLGSLTVAGPTALSSTLGVTGATTLGTLTAGITTLSSAKVTGLNGAGSRVVVAAADGSLSATSALPGSSGEFIQNQTATAQAASFRVNGSGQVGTTLGVGTALTVGTTLGVSGASTLNSATVTNALSAGSLGVSGATTLAGLTAGSSTLSSAVVTNALSAGTLSTSGLATLNSAKVTGLNGVGSRVVVAAADGSLSATSALPGSSGEFIQNQTATAQAASFRVNGSGQVGTTLAVGGATTLAGLTAGSSTLSSAIVTNALNAGSLGVSGATTLSSTLAVVGAPTFTTLGGQGTRLEAV